MKKMKLFLLMFGILASSLVFAYRDAPVSDFSAAEDPVKVIQSAIIKLNQLTTAAAYSPQMMSLLVEYEVTPLFDFNHISREVLLASHINLNNEEAQYFLNSLKQNIVNTLLTKLTQQRSSSLNFVFARPVMGGKNIVVRLNAKGYSRFGLNLDLSFHQGQSGKWQIFDIALDHDSLINYYQRMVRIKVRRYGVYGMLGRI